MGSNSVLLLVAEKEESGWTPIYESSVVTGLGAGLTKHHALQRESINRTLEALREAFSKADSLGVETVHAAGTMALRIAINASAFFYEAGRQGTPVDVISGIEEAELGLRAVLDDPLFRDENRISIIDPGGHSTEIATAIRDEKGEWDEVLHKSYTLGAFTLLEGSFAAPCPDVRDRLAAVKDVDEIVAMEYLPGKAGKAVVLGATGSNLIAMRLGIDEWQGSKIHGQYLDYEDVSKYIERLCEMTAQERAALKGLEPGREFTIHAGALILERLLYCMHVEGCFVSTRGWRHAYLEKLHD